MTLFRNKYRVESPRMPNWDYAGNGIYLLGMQTQHRKHHLGKIVNNEMILSQWGLIAFNEWIKSYEIRKELRFDTFQFMPDHMHALVIINKIELIERFREENIVSDNSGNLLNGETHGRVPRIIEESEIIDIKEENTEKKDYSYLIRKPQSLSSFIAGYKAAVTSKINDWIDTNEPGIPKFNRKNKFWQPNYYSKTLFTKEDYFRYKNYIRNNPLKWNKGDFI